MPINQTTFFGETLALEALKRQGDKVTDSCTLWLYRETWMKAGIFADLFNGFNRTLQDQGVIAKAGSVVGAYYGYKSVFPVG